MGYILLFGAQGNYAIITVGREEIKEIEEIAQRLEVKGSKNNIKAGMDRARSTARSTGVHDVH